MSYQDIGNVRHSNRPIIANITDRQYRRIVVYQKRWLLDNPLINLLSNRPLLFPMKEFMARLFPQVTGTFWILCIATHPRTIPPRRKLDEPFQSKPLQGRLFLFDRKGWKGEVEDSVRQTQRHFHHRSGQYQTLMDNLNNRCQEYADVYADFTLTRNGTVTLELPEGCIRVSTQVPNRVASQLYFFLKDISHEHLHHTPTTDTLTELYSIMTAEGEEDDITWRYETLSRLYRKVFRYSREAHPSSYDNAVGILAYAETFRHISMEALRENDPGRESWDFFPLLQRDDLERSIRANKEAHVSRLRHDRARRDSVKTFLFSVIGTVIGYAGLIRLTSNGMKGIKVDEWLVTIATYLLEKPLHVVVSLFLVYYTYAHLSEHISISDKHYIENLSRLSAPLDYRWQAMIAFGLVGLIQFFVYLLTFSK
ncbi:MAG: hypothetical protein HQL81_13360 [Magnetococcales bacterium]|nr:hypothetical protein [Magnetococcales bacterium]